ncbi:hypothetical protein DFH07DRAFT_794664 [Mycena maculata]|uniref:SWI/SNF and RSC complexes subunit Ssr4 N-terminal domain-containing protein n=1 Tax=Mycena maculata TaxID=230809 RepID=A0AAD7KAF5_9AGAR|nr:hypothetical protein DFH07DRAFT_794664 [Mycena maculata]
MSAFQQAQAEGLCLRFPEPLGIHRDLNMENAVILLLRGTQASATTPYSWGFVDKPPEGQLLLLFLPGNSPFPNDGIRYQEQETNYRLPAGPTRELEVHETKFGFAPGVDNAAWRQRRRYRLTKGGHPQLVLVHYSRGPVAQILPALMNQPVRSYPLRVFNEASVFVMGEKAGQKVYPSTTPQAGAGMGPMPMGMNFGSPQTMVAQQNNNMSMLDRRREQEQRARAGSNTRPPRVEEDDSGDENDTISTRALSLTRYRRNHDIMAEVFTHAAYSSKNAPPPPAPFSIFNKAELDVQTEKLKADIEALHARTAERKLARSAKDQEMAASRAIFEVGDVSMESLGEGIAV